MTESTGRCGDECPTNGEDAQPFDWCGLSVGHAGWHQSDRGTEWFRITAKSQADAIAADNEEKP